MPRSSEVFCTGVLSMSSLLRGTQLLRKGKSQLAPLGEEPPSDNSSARLREPGHESPKATSSAPLFPSTVKLSVPHQFPLLGAQNSALFVVVVQWLSYVRLFVTPWTAAHHSCLSFTISLSLLKLMSVESVMPSNHLILCHPLLLFSIFPSLRIFSSESAVHIRWPKYWSFSFSISPSNEYSGLISFRID